MKTFTSFLNESVGGLDAYKESAKIVEFLSKKIGQQYVELDGQSFTNSTGNYFGYLFVSKSDNSAIRVNWEGSKFHSINFWLDWDYETDPTKEIFLEDAEPGKSAFAKLLPDVAAILKDINSFDDEDSEEANKYDEELDESLLTEKKVEFKGKIYTNKKDLVIKLYEEELDLEDIENIVKLDGEQIKTIIAKYLFSKGGSVTEIADAIDVENNDVRDFVNSPDAADSNVKIDERIKVLKGMKETSVLTKLLKKGEQHLTDAQYADPDFVFDEITEYVELAAKELLPALFVTGQGGIGKSYNIEKVLSEFGKQDDTWVKVSGKSDTKEVFKTLWNNRDKIVLFDDCDSLLKDPSTINVLKQVFVGDEERNVDIDEESGFVFTADMDDNKEIEEKCADWSADHKGKEGIPNHFIFTGSVIFISNLDKAEVVKKDPALLTKCTCVDIIQSAQGVIKRMETILPQIKIYKDMDAKGEGKDITDEEIKEEVFDFICSDEFLKNPKVRGKELNYKIFSQIYKLKYADLPKWKELAFTCG